MYARRDRLSYVSRRRQVNVIDQGEDNSIVISLRAMTTYMEESRHSEHPRSPTKVAPIMIAKEWALIKIDKVYRLVIQLCHQHAYLTIRKLTSTMWNMQKSSSRDLRLQWPRIGDSRDSLDGANRQG